MLRGIQGSKQFMSYILSRCWPRHCLSLYNAPLVTIVFCLAAKYGRLKTRFPFLLIQVLRVYILRWLYSLLLYLILPWVVQRLFIKGARNRGYWKRLHERFGLIPKADGKPIIWVHAVSVGEVRASLPLVDALLQRYPGHNVLITTMTPTGSDQVRLLFGDRVLHYYVPYDLPTVVRRFMNRVHPRLLLVMETELWPNIFHTCGQRKIPLLLANVRLSEKSMKGYRHFSGLMKATLANVSRIAAQSQQDARRIIELGADPSRVEVTGSIKFEQTLPASINEVAESLRADWGPQRLVLLVASTHEGEETQVLQLFRNLKHRFTDLLLVLVPRHPERFAAVARMCKKAGYHVALRSQGGAPLAMKKDILIGDTMGELQFFYAAADVALIGGTLAPVGGHNLLEAAAVGTPSVLGPHTFNFAEITEMACAQGAAVQASDIGQVEIAIAEFLQNPNRRFDVGQAGKQMVEENRGALDKILVLVTQLLTPPEQA